MFGLKDCRRRLFEVAYMFVSCLFVNICEKKLQKVQWWGCIAAIASRNLKNKRFQSKQNDENVHAF